MTDQTDTTIEHAHRYDAAMADRLETLWQEAWASEGVFAQPNPGEPGFDASRPKFYCLDMFPYPSGAGLHVGHPEGYTATDIVCRYMRVNGFNVLHPMGFDAFGLPAEQYALQTNVHPAITTRKAMATFRRQLKRFGFCYDWTREVATIDEDYYRWTQWIFLRLYDAWYDEHAQRARPIAELVSMLEHGDLRIGPGSELVHVGAAQGIEELGGSPAQTIQWHELDPDDRRAFIDAQRLAYLDEQMVTWCPKLGTVLANEEVIDGRSERGGYPVVRKPLRQWLLRITAYADRLLGGLEGLRWPESTRAMQTEWIGKSTGAEIDFALDIETDDPELDADLPPVLRVFTTRPDTVFGSTYMVVAPEHPLVEALLANPRPHTPVDELAAYVEATRARTDIDRQGSKDKTGVFTGLHAINPATGERIAVWTADYVLMGYGFGAIMAVPAHDQRDFEFAAAHGLPIRDVVYSRSIAVMAWFAAHARDEDQTDERWARVLADLIALAVARDATPDHFSELYEMVRARRAGGPTGSSVAIHPGEPASGEPGAVGARRGAQSIGWLDAIEALNLDSFGSLRDTIASASFHARSGEPYSGDGYLANSTNTDSAGEGVSLDGLAVDEAKTRIIDWLGRRGLGRAVTNYRLRDWLFSRQRYWGEPFPIVFDEDGQHWPVHADHLPVALPPLEDFHPVESDEPTALLSKATDWLHTTAGAAGVDGPNPNEPVTREANTMPNWAGSCWYFLRYCDPRNSGAIASSASLDYWLGETGVDLYIGGAEHAVLHLLYARFWHKVLFDLGLVPCDEPFGRLFHQGLITSFAYQRADRSLVPVDEVEERSGKFIEIATGDEVTQITAKMSKSLRNVINPDDVIAQYGADTFRLYEMYLGPLEHSKPWNPRDIGGLYRFLQRLWRVVIDERTGEVVLADEADDALERALHRTIAKVGSDIERLALNTAIAALIEFVNEATGRRERDSTRLSRSQAMRLAQLVMPFAPHIAEELWSRLGQTGFVSNEPWPTYDEAMLVDDQIEIPIQILGKVRSHITIPADADNKTVEALALAEPRVQELIAGKTVRKVIVVPGRLVNLVVG